MGIEGITGIRKRLMVNENELYHSGVPGMKHGVTNGPPYPLYRQRRFGGTGRNKGESIREFKKKVKEGLASHKEAKEAKRAAKMSKFISTASRRQLKKKMQHMTNAELEETIKRLNLMKQASGNSRADPSDPNALPGMKMVNDALTYLKAGADVTNNLANIKNNVERLSKPNTNTNNKLSKKLASELLSKVNKDSKSDLKLDVEKMQEQLEKLSALRNLEAVASGNNVNIGKNNKQQKQQDQQDPQEKRRKKK